MGFKITIDFVYNAFVYIQQALTATLFHIGNHPATALTILQFVFILLLTWWFSRVVLAGLDTVIKHRKGIRKAVIYRIKTLVRYLILTLGLLFALTSIGFDFSNLVIIAGALGVGIGFGLQNIFNNFISGIIILFQDYLKVGDFIVLENGLKGEIREINVSCTVITTNDGVEVIVPNASMISSRIVNWTLRDPYRQIQVPFSVAYGSDIDEVANVVSEAAKKVPCTLEKIGVQEPQVLLMSFGEKSLEMALVVWVNEKWTRREGKTRSMYLWAIEKTLRKHGIEIPFPAREIHIQTVIDKEQLAEILAIQKEKKIL